MDFVSVFWAMFNPHPHFNKMSLLSSSASTKKTSQVIALAWACLISICWNSSRATGLSTDLILFVATLLSQTPKPEPSTDKNMFVKSWNQWQHMQHAGRLELQPIHPLTGENSGCIRRGPNPKPIRSGDNKIGAFMVGIRFGPKNRWQKPTGLTTLMLFMLAVKMPYEKATFFRKQI